MNCTQQVSGICPECGRSLTITVTLKEIRMAGNPTPGYVPTGYRCEYSSKYGCTRKGEDGRSCPLFKKVDL